MGARNDSTKPRWRLEHVARKPDGGFVLIPAWALVAAWWASKTGDLRPVDLRVWLASFECVARRCRAQRGCPVRYTAAELGELVGAVSERSVRSGLRRLERVGLMAWSERGPERADHLDRVVLTRPGPMLDALSLVSMHDRRVPMPRRLLRELCRSNSPALLATSFGHLLRGLFNGRRACRSGGLCKASWVAEVFGISERSVKRCRARLAASGVLLSERVPQRVMNRHGGCTRWNLRWASGPGRRLAPGPRAMRVHRVYVSPPRALADVTVTPPKETSNSLSGVEHHQPVRCTRTTASSRRDAHGARASRIGTAASVHRTRGLGHVRVKDLRSGEGLRRLFVRATTKGLVRRSEAGALAFAAAAVHAQRVATRNPCGLFATVVRLGLWSHVSHEDEERARRVASSLLPPRIPPTEESERFIRRCRSEPVVTAAKRERIRKLIAESLGCTEVCHVEHFAQTAVGPVCLGPASPEVA